MRLDQLCVASEAETAVILPHVVSLCRCRKSIQRFKLLMQWDEKNKSKSPMEPTGGQQLLCVFV